MGTNRHARETTDARAKDVFSLFTFIFSLIQWMIAATPVAQGMKVALITTIFGIVVALILQLFYSYILSKIERLTSQMEESAITLLDMITDYKINRKS